MEMTVQDYAKKIESGDFESTEQTLTGTQIQQKSNLVNAIKKVVDDLSQGKLSQYKWTVKTLGNETVSIRLESNIINIPMDEALRLDGKLLNADKEYAVNLYMVAESTYVNRTGLRIDVLVEQPDVKTNVDQLAGKAQVWIAEKLALVAQNRKEAKKKTTKTKKTSKKTTTTKKKSSPKKSTKSKK